MPSEGKLEGENARKHKLLSINKTPNNTSSLHQMSGFLRPRAALCFLSSRAALYFTKTADDDDDDDGGERKPCLPLNRENRERIFSSLKGCFFSSFLPFVRYFQRYFLFATKRESKTLSLPFFLYTKMNASQIFLPKKVPKKTNTNFVSVSKTHFFLISSSLSRAQLRAYARAYNITFFCVRARTRARKSHALLSSINLYR
jgi:hypothetical protein